MSLNDLVFILLKATKHQLKPTLHPPNNPPEMTKNELVKIEMEKSQFSSWKVAANVKRKKWQAGKNSD